MTQQFGPIDKAAILRKPPIESLLNSGTLSDDRVTRIDAAITDITRFIVNRVVEYRIEGEYGHPNEGENAAVMLATAGISMDIHRTFVAINGTDHGVDSLAATLLRQLVNAGLEARRCQCAVVNPNKLGGHNHISGRCGAHYEADVPELGGKRLCGSCHVAIWQAIKFDS